MLNSRFSNEIDSHIQYVLDKYANPEPGKLFTEIFNQIEKSFIFVLDESRDLRVKQTKTNSPYPYEPFFISQLPQLNQISSNNLVEILNKLHISKDRSDAIKLKKFEKICEEDGFDVSVIETHAMNNERSRELKILETSLEHVYGVDDLSSGQLQKIFFNLVCAFSNNSILLYEEPENNLHPSLQKLFFSKLTQISGQIILTTHSRNFIPEKISSIFCISKNSKNETRISYLTKPQDIKITKSFFNQDKDIFLPILLFYVKAMANMHYSHK